MLFSDWPAQSPDLNPIGNRWRIIKYNISKGRWQGLGGTGGAVTDGVDAISQETIQTLIESMPHRIASAIMVDILTIRWKNYFFLFFVIRVF